MSMKKLKFVFFTLLLFIPAYVKAYGIENYYIDATIESNGDLLVQEYFNMTGDFNGFERIIKYANDDLYEFDSTMTSFGGSTIHNGTGLEILEVRAVPIDSTFDFINIGGDVFTESNSASKGDYGVYTISNNDYGKNILIYNPSSYHKAFYIKYVLKNMAIRHNDVGEIGWNVVGNQLSESIGSFKVYLHIPGNTNIRAWAHGPIYGNVNIVDMETVLFTIDNLSSHRAVDIRATFDLNVISESTKYTNTDALDKIILYETDKAEQANYERQNEENIRINNALYCLNNFEVNPTRYNYEIAQDAIEKITTPDVKEEYLQRLAEIKVTLDEIEEKAARKALDFAIENPEYFWYKDAKEKIEILDDEVVKSELLEELVKVENEIKKIELKKEKINYIFGFILIIIILVLAYIIYRKYVKDPDTEFNYRYFREIPNNYSPETVSYLFHKKIINRSMSASLLDLINRKIITAEKLSSSNYRLTINESSDGLVTNLESKLLDLIFGGKASIETKYMKSDAQKNYDSFIRRWNSYQRAALSSSKSNLFYETDGKQEIPKKSHNSKTIIIIVLLIVSISIFPLLIIPIIFFLILFAIIKGIFKLASTKDKAIFVIDLIACGVISLCAIIKIFTFQKFYNQSFVIYIFSLVLSIIFIPFVFYSKKRTQNGAEEYKKWKAFKNFLNDFGKFSDKEVPEIALWEKYLVYATLFGCAEKVIKVMKIEMVDAPNNYFDTYLDLYVMNQCISRAVRNSYGSAQSAYAAAHSSSSGGGFSSGSGGGGGFSSGGGSFGGGGGGGRF